MKLTVITATCDRPAAFRLCDRYLMRQTRLPDQWLILDDGLEPVEVAPRAGLEVEHYLVPQFRGPRSMAQKVLWALENNLVKGDALAFVEDDDFYQPGWLDWAVRKLESGYDLVGEGMAAYYHVGNRWWSCCFNVRHAALCQTVVSRELYEALINVIHAYDSPFFDGRVWALDCQKFLALPKRSEDRRVVGIKGIKSSAGTTGYSGEHRQILPPGCHADPSLLTLHRWIGDDARHYLPFKR